MQEQMQLGAVLVEVHYMEAAWAATEYIMLPKV